MLNGVASIVATEAAAFVGTGSVRNRLADTPNSPILFLSLDSKFILSNDG